MALTPDDIVNFEFKTTVRGYAIPQVDDLLDRLADQVERSEREIDDLRQRLRETEARLGSTLETESTLKRTLVTAQQAAERALEDARLQADELRTAAEREVTEQLEEARKEADEVTQRAREEADQVTARAQEAARAELHSAREERVALESRLDQLREMEHRHRTMLRRHLESQLAVLEDFDGLPDEGVRDDVEHVAPAASGSPLQVRVREEDEPAIEPSRDAAAFGQNAHDTDDAPAHGDAPTGPIPAVRTPDPAEPAAEHEPSPAQSEPSEGLFDHDPIDITDEVAVPSPWDPTPEPESQPPPAADEAPSPWERAAEQGFQPPPADETPSPWMREAALPPPNADEREAADEPPTHEHGHVGEPHDDHHEADRPDERPAEDDPYEHYDRFRDPRHDDR